MISVNTPARSPPTARLVLPTLQETPVSDSILSPALISIPRDTRRFIGKNLPIDQLQQSYSRSLCASSCSFRAPPANKNP